MNKMVHVNLRITEDQKKEIYSLIIKTGCTESEVMRELFERGLSEMMKTYNPTKETEEGTVGWLIKELKRLPKDMQVHHCNQMLAGVCMTEPQLSIRQTMGDRDAPDALLIGPHEENIMAQHGSFID